MNSMMAQSTEHRAQAQAQVCKCIQSEIERERESLELACGLAWRLSPIRRQYLHRFLHCLGLPSLPLSNPYNDIFFVLEVISIIRTTSCYQPSKFAMADSPSLPPTADTHSPDVPKGSVRFAPLGELTFGLPRSKLTVVEKTTRRS